MSVHTNSRLAYLEEQIRLSKRAKACLEAIQVGGPMKNREVLSLLGLPDMNCVRPRITELIKLELVEECGKVRCEITNKSVRIIRLAEPSGQLEMSL